MPKISVNGTPMNVFDAGQGGVVCFVHGFPLNHTMWEPQLAEFQKTHRVIAPDLRGFGGSEVTSGTVSMKQFADDLAAMLDELSITEPIVLCGLSMGGYIAWQFAKLYGDRLKGLIPCDTKATADSEEAVQNRHKLAESVLRHGSGVVAQAMPEKLFAKTTLEDKKDIVVQCKSMMLEAHPEGIAAALRGMAERPDMSDFLPEISVPTLVVVGEHDQITTRDEMQTMSAQIANAEFLEVPNAGHMAPLECPDVVNPAMDRFLKSLA